jgi:hypothetical protein
MHRMNVVLFGYILMMMVYVFFLNFIFYDCSNDQYCIMYEINTIYTGYSNVRYSWHITRFDFKTWRSCVSKIFGKSGKILTLDQRVMFWRWMIKSTFLTKMERHHWSMAIVMQLDIYVNVREILEVCVSICICV